MLSEHNLTEARKGFSALYDEVFNSFRPSIIKRKKTEELLMLRVDSLKMLLSHFSLKPEIIQEEDGSVTLALEHLEMFVNADSAEKALQELMGDLKFYADDYLERAQLFMHAPNRRNHFPYILRVLLCDSDKEIRELLEI